MKRSRRLVVVDHVVPAVERAVAEIQNLRRSMYAPPKTRGDCITGTPNTGSKADRLAGLTWCKAYACREHLYFVDSGSRPGRRHHGLAPEGTLTDRGDCSSPSCALDVADGGPRSADEIARLTGFTKRRIEQVLKAAREGKLGPELQALERGEE